MDEQLLPDPAQGWAWAHVQVAAALASSPLSPDAFVAELQALHERSPSLACSRLLCPIVLEPLTAYAAFVVPRYEAGRRALLGGDVPATSDLAWRARGDDTARELPVLYRWQFRTTEGGDFEELLDRLKVDAGYAGRVAATPIDGSRPGTLLAADGAEKTYPLGRGPKAARDTFPADGALVVPGSRAPFAPSPFTEDLRALLDAELDAEAPRAGTQDPLVAPPVYGRYFQGASRLPVSPAKFPRRPRLGWLAELNLDRRDRVAAAAGTAAVQSGQEGYVTRCWEQVGAVRDANTLLRLGAAAALAGESARERHLDPLDDLRFAFATEPAHGQLVHDDGAHPVSFARRFRESGLPAGLVTAPLRKVLAAKAGVGCLAGQALFGDWLTAGARAGRTPDADGEWLGELARVIDVESPAREARAPALRPLKPERVRVTAIDVTGALRPLVDVRVDIVRRLRDQIALPGGRRLVNLDPILVAPHLDDPMYRELMARSMRLLSPGVGELEANTVVVLEENRRFIESFMVGLNHELSRELLWREYPTDQRGTVFRFFWDPAAGGAPPPDIQDVAAWKKALGGNAPTPAAGRAVLTIKADLVRRYPDAILFAVSSALAPEDWDWGRIHALLDGDGADARYRVVPPAFRASSDVDTVFLGFPFSVADALAQRFHFVVMEHPSLPRFGLDAHHAATSSGGWDALSRDDVTLAGPRPARWVDVQPLAQVPAGVANARPEPEWGADGGAMAYITFQKPVRAVIPAGRLLRPGTP